MLEIISENRIAYLRDIEKIFFNTQRTPVGDITYMAATNILRKGNENYPIILGLIFGNNVNILLSSLSQEEKSLEISDTPKEHLISSMLEAYFSGNFQSINKILTYQPESKFYAAVRQSMRRIPAGETNTYQQLAAKAGNLKAARAAGTACATNRIALVVPCHRIVRSGGSLGNYAWGLETKKQLLEHEQKNFSNTHIYGKL